MFFAQGISDGFAKLFATHPPLPKRILAIDPHWNHKFPKVDPSSKPRKHPRRYGYAQKSSLPVTASLAETNNLTVDDLQLSIDHIGTPSPSHQQYAQQLIKQIPPPVRDVLHDSYGARAVIFGMLLDRDMDIRSEQIKSLRRDAEESVVDLTLRLIYHTQPMPPHLRLPTIDAALPALKAMSQKQYLAFQQSLENLIAADRKISVFEWGLARIVDWNLRPAFQEIRQPRIRFRQLKQLHSQINHLLSVVAYVGHDRNGANAAYGKAAQFLGNASPNLTWRIREPESCSLTKLEQDLLALRQAAFKIRGLVLKSCLQIVHSDGIVRPAEAELIRGIAEMLECPMPPILPGQKILDRKTR
jgi:hypothetical protein